MHQIKTQLRHAFTLVEMLIAMALTLILVYAVAEFYAYVGTAVRDSRALIEMGSQLRSASQQLHDDLNSLTLRPEPWIDSQTSPGYFTVYEGQQCDAYPDWYVDATATDILADTDNDKVPDAIRNLNITTLIGDGDDMLAMTIRAKDVDFQGQVWDSTRSQYVSASSQYAEVIWYTTFDDLDSDGRWGINEPRYLFRRQLLILPNYNLQLPAGVNLAQFFQEAEVSFRVNSAGNPVANTLADLSLRHNRYGCQLQNPPAYPSHMWINPTNAASLARYSMGGTRLGEDRVLPNLLAFDVRVYDPTAPIHQDSSGAITALTPGDPGFGRNGSTQVGVGAWVDLSYERMLSAGAGNSHFSELPPAPFNLPAPTRANAASQPYNFNHWDTWSQNYEMPNLRLGASFNGTGFLGNGQAFDGQDNNNQYGVDDPTERRTQPPYSAPLRGVQVRLRIYEPQTRQARQVTVGADFVAE